MRAAAEGAAATGEYRELSEPSDPSLEGIILPPPSVGRRPLAEVALLLRVGGSVLILDAKVEEERELLRGSAVAILATKRRCAHPHRPATLHVVSIVCASSLEKARGEDHLILPVLNRLHRVPDAVVRAEAVPVNVGAHGGRTGGESARRTSWEMCA